MATMSIPGLDTWIQDGDRQLCGCRLHTDACPDCRPERFCRHGVEYGEDCYECDAEADEVVAGDLRDQDAEERWEQVDDEPEWLAAE